MCPGFDLFWFILFGVCSIYWAFTKFGENFSHYFLGFFLNLTLFFLSGTEILDLLSYFSLFRLAKFHWFALTFTYSILCHLQTIIESMSEFFILVIVFLSSISPIQFSFISSISLLKCSVVFICFKNFHGCSLKPFSGGCFKILSRLFQCLTHFGIGVCWLSFLI